MPAYPNINLHILQLAAQTAGESLWQKFPKLNQWISGEKKPTVKQLALFAKDAHIPFGFFFLENLPQNTNTIPLFRSGFRKPVFDYSWELQQTIRDMQRRQFWVEDYLAAEGAAPLDFVGVAIGKKDIIKIAANIRKVLDIPLNWAQFANTKDDALNYLIHKIEAKGIFVTVNGVIGNSAKNLNPDEFKGFVLSSKTAPFVFINGKDFPASKIFTLMHEVVHIWLDKTAILDLENLLPPESEEEKLCDAVAAELLLPEEILIDAWEIVKNNPNHLQELERKFKVSRVVIARRLLDMDIYSKPKFFAFYNAYKEAWQKKQDSKTGGGDFYLNQPYRVGRAFFSLVSDAVKQGKLLYTDAYKLTNLHGKTYHEYENRN